MLKATRVLFLLILLFPVYSGHTQSLPYNKARLYSAEALKADLRFVQQNLEKKHAGLYRYISKASLNRFFDSLHHAITKPMTAQSFFNLLTLLHNRIRNGHTMFLPGDPGTAFYNRNGRHFPFKVYFAEEKLYIVENHSTDSTIQPGAEILRINGTGVSSIIEQLLLRMTRDGYNLTYPAWVLNHYFPAYYSFVFGQPETYSLELKDSAGELHLKQIAAVPRDSIQYYREIRYTARYPAVNDGQGIVLQEEKESNTAVLTIKTFDTDLLQSKYRQNYKQVFDSIFKLINHRQTRNLILDLRDNQGGNFVSGRTLLTYLVQSPSRFLVDGTETRVIQPRAAHFKGRLFVLMNGGSFSNTAIVCACLKRDKRALFIGEETGGNSHVISGDPVELILPRTKIKAYISSVTYRIITGANDGHGVMPDYELLPSVEDILTDKDPAKSLALKLISER